MTDPRRGRLERILAGWTRLVLRRPYRVIAASGALALGALVYAAGNLGINTDTAEMLSPELSFRRNNELYKELFPGSRAGITLVIDATTADLADRAAARPRLSYRSKLTTPVRKSPRVLLRKLPKPT